MKRSMWRAAVGVAAWAAQPGRPAAAAATYTWDAAGASPGRPADGAGTWDGTAARWSTGSADVAWPGGSAVAAFGGGNGPAGTVRVYGYRQVGGLAFHAAGAGDYTLVSQTSDDILYLPGRASVAVDAGVSPTIAARVAGAALNVAGPGTLVLSGTNSYTGGTTVTGGTLDLRSASALGTGGLGTAAGSATVVNADLTVAGDVTNAGTLTVAAGRTLTLGSAAVAFNQSAGTLAINGTLALGQRAFYDLGGTITGGPVTFAGGGSVSFGPNAAPVAASFAGPAGAAANLYAAGGRTDVPATAVVTVAPAAGTASLTVGVATNRGALSVTSPDGGSATVRGAFANAGTVSVAATGTPSQPAALTDAVTNAAAGTLTVGVDLALGRSLVNAGTMAVAAGKRLLSASSGSSFNQAGGTLRLSGPLAVGTDAFYDVGGAITGGTIVLPGGTAYFGPAAAATTVAFTGPVGQIAGTDAQAAVPAGVAVSVTSAVTGGDAELVVSQPANAGVLTVAAPTLGIATLLFRNGVVNTGAIAVTGDGSRTRFGDLIGPVTNAAGGRLDVGCNESAQGTITNAGGTVTVAAALTPLSFSGPSPTPVTSPTYNQSAGSTTIAAGGSLTLAGIGHPNLSGGTVMVAAGGRLAVTGGAPAAARAVVTIGSLSLDPAGTVDVGGNDLDLPGADLATVTARVAVGFAGGTWQGPGGIVSSAAAADAKHLSAVGAIGNGQVGAPVYTAAHPFDGATPGAADVLVRYTTYGDADLSGAVDGADYTRVDAGYASVGALTGWYNGDFNYDGTIDGSDYTLIDNAYNRRPAAASPTGEVAAVPEPAAVGVALGTVPFLVAGRRRRRSRGG